MIQFADDIIIGGGMAFTFVKSMGGLIGKSIFEEHKIEEAIKIVELAKQKKLTCISPDVICSKSLSNDKLRTCDIAKIPNNLEGFDAGPESLKQFHNIIMNAKTILWNGPVGVFEEDKFSKGTITVGNSVSESTKKGAYSLVGGGDSVAAVKKFNFQNKVSYISTGGGAMLESIEGKELPGIKALSEKIV